MTTEIKITPALRRILEMAERAGRGSGSMATMGIMAGGGRGPGHLRKLVAHGLLAAVEDPTGLRSGGLHKHVTITEAGRRALAGETR